MTPQIPVRYSVRLLGGFAIRRDARLQSIRPSSRRLIALLALERGLDRSDAAARLFDSVPASKAAGNLRTVLRRTRDDVRGLVSEEGTTLGLACDDIDVHIVHDWSSAVVHGSVDRQSPPPQVGHDLLPGWGEPWLIDHREHLHFLQLYALEECAATALAAGRFGEAASCALRALVMDPLRETATRLLIEVFLREGNVVEALRRYRQYERLLDREADALPGAALQALVAPLMTPRATLAPRGPLRPRSASAMETPPASTSQAAAHPHVP